MVEDWSDPVFCVYDGFRVVYLEPNMFCWVWVFGGFGEGTWVWQGFYWGLWVLWWHRVSAVVLFWEPRGSGRVWIV